MVLNAGGRKAEPGRSAAEILDKKKKELVRKKMKPGEFRKYTCSASI